MRRSSIDRVVSAGKLYAGTNNVRPPRGWETRDRRTAEARASKPVSRPDLVRAYNARLAAE